MRPLTLALVTSGKCKMGVHDLGQHYPVDISAAHSECPAFSISVCFSHSELCIKCLYVQLLVKSTALIFNWNENLNAIFCWHQNRRLETHQLESLRASCFSIYFMVPLNKEEEIKKKKVLTSNVCCHAHHSALLAWHLGAVRFHDEPLSKSLCMAGLWVTCVTGLRWENIKVDLFIHGAKLSPALFLVNVSIVQLRYERRPTPGETRPIASSRLSFSL